MTASLQAKKASLEATLGRVAGFKVELTVTGWREDKTEFTVSAEGRRDFAKVVAFLKMGRPALTSETLYDEETDGTYLYITF